MYMIDRRQGFTLLVLWLSAALPQLGFAQPCPLMPRRYTATAEQQLRDQYDVYDGWQGQSGLEENIKKLTAAYHNGYVNTVPAIPEPKFLEYFGKDIKDIKDIPDRDFQKFTAQLHQKSPIIRSEPPVFPKCDNTGQNPAHCGWEWAWGVNPKHNDFNASYFQNEDVIKNLRCRPEGVTLIGYALPPKAASHENPNFLATITDLTGDDVAALQRLKKQTLDYLAQTFGYDEKSDTAQLYFHWPTGRATSVLHLHAKINFSMSPCCVAGPMTGLVAFRLARSACARHRW